MPLFTAVAALLIVQIDQPPAANQLLQALLDQRLAIHRGQLHFTVEDNERHFAFDYEYSFDGSSRRMDVTLPPASFRSPGSTVPSDYSRVDTYIVTDDEFVYHVAESRPDPEKYAVHRVSMAEWRENVRNDPRYENAHPMHKHAFDPRIIGVATQQFGAWWRIGLSDVLESETLRAGTVTSETLSNESVWVVDADHESGVHTRLWISPDKGGCIVASRVELQDTDSSFADVMSAEITQYPSGDEQVWFPSEVQTYREFPDRRSSEVVLRIQSAEFNGEIPPAVFTLEERE